jgi:two-component system sensor histidine kinase BaeS
LFDADGRQLAGDTLEGTDGEPVRVALHADGSRIGELRSIARRRFETPQATAFARQQWQASLAIALVALVMATLVSWWLARALLAPLRRTIDGVTELANGDYSLRLNERRDDELGTLMDGLNRLAEALEKNQSARRRWLADIAHELRTPVTILAGELEALKDGIREPDPAQLESLDQEVQRLRRLVDDLNTLSLSDLGGLRYTFTELDLAGRLDQALGPVRIRAAERGLDLEVDLEDAAGSLIRADPTRIDQLLTNLFENALAYTEAPGRIAIRLRRDGDALLLSVCDSPPGVAADDCERIFEPLYRQDGSRSRRTAGAGLGLAICRNIVEAHRGEISAAPSPFGGLCIQVTFPALNRTIR